MTKSGYRSKGWWLYHSPGKIKPVVGYYPIVGQMWVGTVLLSYTAEGLVIMNEVGTNYLDIGCRSLLLGTHEVIGSLTGDGSSGDFQIGSTLKVPRLPNLTTAQRNAIDTPQNGDTIYNVDAHSVQVFINGTWENMSFG